MEEKWALFYHQARTVCVRSWTRQVRAVAEVQILDDHVRIAGICGATTAEDEGPEMTVRVLEYLLISHALGTVFPSPLPRRLLPESARGGTVGRPPAGSDLRAMAAVCMSLFVRRAHFAAVEPVERPRLHRPLRADSLLHIAAARGDPPTIDALMSSGLPIDLPSRSGMAPLHRAAAVGDEEVMGQLLEHEASVDVVC
jgi:hypothetical protein